METQVKTKSVTNTQIGVAVAVALLAGGLAFAAAPRNKQKAPACTTQSVEWINSCPKAGQYRTARYTCSDGSSGQVVGNSCRSTGKLQQAVDRACSRKRCPVAAAPEAAPVSPVAPAPTPEAPQAPAANPNQCGLREISFADSCGNGKYEKVEFGCTDGYRSSENTTCSSLVDLQNRALRSCAERDCRPLPEASTNTNTNTDTNPVTAPTPDAPPQNSITKSFQKISEPGAVEGSPVLFISGKEIQFTPVAGKVNVSIRLGNRGTGKAMSDAKYALYFLDGQRNVLQMLDLNLSSYLDVGEEKAFETVLPIPEGALFAEVVVDRSYSDGTDNDLTTMIPTELFVQ